MNNIITSLGNQYYHIIDSMEGAKRLLYQRVNEQVAQANDFAIASHVMIQQRCVETSLRVKQFASTHAKTIVFIGFSATTAYFAPQIFFPTVVATIILKIQLAHYLEELANENLKVDKNPYLLHPQYGPEYVSSFDMTMGGIAAVDSFAIATIYFPSTWTVAALPILGGLATGNCLAKYAMDTARSWTIIRT